MIDPRANAMERLGIWAGSVLLVLLCFSTVAPYVCAWLGVAVPNELMRLVDQNQNTIQNLAVGLWSFLFGASVGSRMKDSTISQLAAGAPPAPGVNVAMQPGDQVKVTAAPSESSQ